jgi:hypothetical protein
MPAHKQPYPTGIRLAGNPGAVQQPSYVHLSRTQGNQWVKTFKGIYVSIQSLFALNAPGAVESEYQQDGAVATARFTYAINPLGAAEAPVQVLDVEFDTVQLDIFKSPKYAVVPDDRVRLIKTLFDNIRAKTYLASTANADFAADYALVATQLSGMEMNAFDLLIAGDDTFSIEVPRLVLTQTVSQGFPNAFTFAGVGQIYSDAQVTAFLGVAVAPFVKPFGYKNVGAREEYVPGWRRTNKTSMISNGNYSSVDSFVWGYWPDTYSLFAPGP